MTSSALQSLLGYAAGAITTVSFVPQVVKALKTRHTADLSLSMLATFAVGVALWLGYGILIGSPPVTLANSVTLLLVLLILGVKLRCG